MTLLQPSAFLENSAAKVGIFAPPGAGKTLTSILLAIGISKELCNGAAIAFVDPEGAAEFIKPVCDIEQVPLFVVPSRTFVDMRDALTEAEAGGCCAFVVDHYDGIFRELTEAQKTALNLIGRKLPYQHREELVRIWDAWVRQFRASPVHCVFNGRLAWEWGDDEDESGDPVKVKLGTKMRGESDAGYEPNLLIELEAIQDKEKRDRKTRSKQGHITHFARVLKDRRMVLNGRSFSWKDLNGYKADDYKRVWKDFAAHFAMAPGITKGAGQVASGSGRSSNGLFVPVSGESSFAERSRRVTIAIEELQAALNAIWPGQGGEEKKMRAIVLETIFKSRSWTAIEGMTAEAVEAGWAIMRHFESAAQDINVRSEPAVVALIQSCKDLERERVEASVL